MSRYFLIQDGKRTYFKLQKDMAVAMGVSPSTACTSIRRGRWKTLGDVGIEYDPTPGPYRPSNPHPPKASATITVTAPDAPEITPATPAAQPPPPTITLENPETVESKEPEKPPAEKPQEPDDPQEPKIIQSGGGMKRRPKRVRTRKFVRVERPLRQKCKASQQPTTANTMKEEIAAFCRMAERPNARWCTGVPVKKSVLKADIMRNRGLKAETKNRLLTQVDALPNVIVLLNTEFSEAKPLLDTLILRYGAHFGIESYSKAGDDEHPEAANERELRLFYIEQARRMRKWMKATIEVVSLDEAERILATPGLTFDADGTAHDPVNFLDPL